MRQRSLQDLAHGLATPRGLVPDYEIRGLKRSNDCPCLSFNCDEIIQRARLRSRLIFMDVNRLCGNSR